jgi:menaquinone-specific isochorismate synthase
MGNNIKEWTMQDIKVRTRGFLPHLEKKDGIYFITFRLADSLPGKIRDQYKDEKEKIERSLNAIKENYPYEKRKAERLLRRFIENVLDSGHGECNLANPEIAEIMSGALKFFDGKRYELLAWCLMPNHVHVVVKIYGYDSLRTVVKSWKGFTAYKVNKILGRKGTFWYREYYDHLIRDEKELCNAISYVIGNPIKANLKDWKWVWVNENAFEIQREQIMYR